jgi:hypothetical protein
MLLVTYDSQLLSIHVTQLFVSIKLRYSFVLAKIVTKLSIGAAYVVVRLLVQIT